MPPNNNDTQLGRPIAEAIEEYDVDEQRAILEALQDDPEAVREWLITNGYLTPETVTSGQDPDRELTDAQRQLDRVLEKLGNPRSAKEVVEFVQTEAPDLVEQYSSAKHRSWMSQQLNALVEAGRIGRFKKGREVKYTATIKEAVQRWAMQDGRFGDELDIQEVSDIANDTGMPAWAVRQAIDDLLEESD